MPARVKKIAQGKRRGKCEVVTPEGDVTAKGTTKEKAEAQRRLLEGVKHGWRPTGKKKKAA
ncbi:MAG: hypothetical protein HY893_01135 [Deltaproteobacteria bacterium]|nr:hypothetical protein [Deltaproteobacteria bacterium]